VLARGGSVRLAAGDMLSLAVRQSSLIVADEITIEGGVQGLVQVSGELNADKLAPHGEGGRIEILGDYIEVQAGAELLASGPNGGGTILVGGDEAGGGELRRSSATYVDRDALLQADATDTGDGGKIVVWSDGLTQAYGEIVARGGVNGGSGGFAETSGKRWLDVDRIPDLTARSGLPGDRGGHWLIDPMNIEVVDDAGCDVVLDEQDCFDQTLEDIDLSEDPVFSILLRPNADMDNTDITADLIAQTLAKGIDLTLTTQNANVEPEGEDGNITVNSAIVVLANDNDDNVVNVDEGTRAQLTMLAAKDIILNESILNENENFTLDVQLTANDTGQPQSPDDDDPNEDNRPFEGDLTLTAGHKIDTGGGFIQLRAVNVWVESGAEIVTEGGSVTITGDRGNVDLRGTIDTTSGAIDDTNDPDAELPIGGSVTIRAAAWQSPQSLSEDAPEDPPVHCVGDVCGGDITIGQDTTTTDAEIITDGGDLRINALGGNLTVNSNVTLDTAFAGERGGKVTLQAQPVVPFAIDPQTEEETPDRSGGYLTLSLFSKILTGGSDLDINRETTGLDGSLASVGARNILLMGEIDTRVQTVRDLDGEWEAPDTTQIGGSVWMELAEENEGDEHRVQIAGATITTNGGRFSSLGADQSTDPPSRDGTAGAFEMTQSTINTLAPDVEEVGGGDSLIVIYHEDAITISGSSQLLAQNELDLRAGADGTGDLSIALDVDDVVVLQADEIGLWAGDGYTPTPEDLVPEDENGLNDQLEIDDFEARQEARVLLGMSPQLELRGVPDADDPMASTNPSQFELVQDAQWVDAGVPDKTLFELDHIDGMNYTLGSRDADLLGIDASKISGSDSELTLVGATGLSLTGTLAATGLESLDIFTAEGFTVDTALAGQISQSAKSISITSGALGNNEAADLIIADDIRTAGDDSSLTLHSGADASGNLVIEDGVTLESDRITLWAGTGVAPDPSVEDPPPLSLVEIQGDKTVTFEYRVANAEDAEFVLRQDGPIGETIDPDTEELLDSTAPSNTQFDIVLDGNVDPEGNIDDIQYTLRSDQSTITIDKTKDYFARTNLSLHFRSIDTDSFLGFDDTLEVSSLDIGGLDDFQYSQAIDDKFVFWNDVNSDKKIVIRAGLAPAITSLAPVLSFANDVIVEADEIRLVAGDGLSGSGAHIVLHPSGTASETDPIFRSESGEAVKKFVYRQEGVIFQSDLPTESQFWDDDEENPTVQNPLVYAIRADQPGSRIILDEYSSTGAAPDLPHAEQKLILSADSIELLRADGSNLVLDEFADGVGLPGAPDLTGAVEIRTENLFMQALRSPDEDPEVPVAAPKVVASGNAFLTGFDVLDFANGQPGNLVPQELNLDARQDALDGALAKTSPDFIWVQQDAAIEAADLLDPAAQLFAEDPDDPDDPADPFCEEDACGLGIYRLESIESHVEVTPEAVVGSALQLSAGFVDEIVNDDDTTTPATYGEIFFGVGGGGDAKYELDALEALAQGGFTVGASDGTTALTLYAKNALSLSAGLSDVGDLDFSTTSDVVLRSEFIKLAAGSELGVLSIPDPIDADTPLVHANDSSKSSSLTLEFLVNEDGERGDFQIRQHGHLRDADLDPLPSDPEDPDYDTRFYSLLPSIDQMWKVTDAVLDEDGIEASPATSESATTDGVLPIDVYFASSDLGDITVSNLFVDGTGSQRLFPAATSVNLFAGAFDPESTGTITLGQEQGWGGAPEAHLDLREFSFIRLNADHIALKAGGPDGLLKLQRDEDSTIIFSDAEPILQQLSPLSLHVSQEPGFDERDGDCDSRGCLPDLVQFVSLLQFTNADSAVDYTIESTDGSIQLYEPMVPKVFRSDLTLLAADDGDIDTPDVVLAPNRAPTTTDSNTVIGEDLELTSLTVGQSGLAEGALPSDTFGILLSDDLSEGGAPLSTPDFVIAESMTLHGHTYIDGKINLIGENIHFGGDLTFFGSDPAQLRVQTWGLAHFGGDINLDRDNAESLLSVEFFSLFDSAGSLRLDGDSVAVDTARFLGVERASVDDAAGTPIIRESDVATIYAPVIPVVVEDGDDDPENDVVIRDPRDLTFNVRNFEMGQGEKLSVAGQLTINASETARIGDLSAIDIMVVADEIEIVRRAAGPYLATDGRTLSDGGIDFVANEINFCNAGTLATCGTPASDDYDGGDIELVGTGRTPAFGVLDTFDTPEWMNQFPVAVLNGSRTALTVDSFDWSFTDPPAAMPDLHPTGTSRDDYSNIFFEPEMVRKPDPWQPAPWLIPEREPLVDLDIDPRPSRLAETLSRLEHAGIIDDVGQDSRQVSDGLITVAEARLSTLKASQARDLYLDLFGPGKSRAEHVREVLADSLDLYRRNSGARRIVGFELRRYVKNRPSTQFEAYRALEDLNLLFSYHRHLGLTPGEYTPIQHQWLAAIKPDGITIEELSEAIHPSRYVRGSDVLDIFGE